MVCSGNRALYAIFDIDGGVTRGRGRAAPGDTLQGVTLTPEGKFFCGQNDKEQWRNEVGQVKKVWGDTLEGVTPE